MNYQGPKDFSNVLRKRLVIEATGISAELLPFKKESIEHYLRELSGILKMTIIHGPVVGAFAKEFRPDYYGGLEGHLIWAESGCQLYAWDGEFSALTVDIYTCKDFDIPTAIDFTSTFFGCSKLEWMEVPPLLQDDPSATHLAITRTRMDMGLFASKPFKAGTLISQVRGSLHHATSELALPTIARNTALPLNEHYYWNPVGGSNFSFLNHSCDPNAYIRNSFEIVAMRDIQVGEEILISYSLICNSDWENPEGVCLCGSEQCHGRILPWRDLPVKEKMHYLPYASDWIRLAEMESRGYLQQLVRDLAR